MVKVVWTQRALYDLEDIADFIAKDSSKYAKLTLERLIDTSSIIESTPTVGRIVPEINDPIIREIILGNYRVIFQIRNNSAAYILTILHSARLFRLSDTD